VFIDDPNIPVAVFIGMMLLACFMALIIMYLEDRER
jgi:hypothetical protein